MDAEVDDAPSTAGVRTKLSDIVTNIQKRKRLDGESSDIDVSNLGYDPHNRNRFGLLAGLEIESVESSQESDKTESANVKKAAITKKNSFCPPIFIYNVNIKHLVQQLEAKTPKIQFKIKNVSREKSKLYFSDASVHANMMALLRENGVHSYSYTPKQFKQMSLVLRGLCYGLVADEVKEALDAVAPDVVSRVSKFTTPYSSKNEIDTGLFLINLLPGRGLNDVSQIKYLLSQSIIWEKPKRKTEEIQCHRCQRWGHVSPNCNAEFKCVKCNQKHNPGECQRQKSDTSGPHCVNCNEVGHPANWRGCPTYRKHLEKRKEQLRKVQELKETAKSNVNRTIISSLRSPGKSFASLFKPNQSLTAPSKKNHQ